MTSQLGNGFWGGARTIFLACIWGPDCFRCPASIQAFMGQVQNKCWFRVCNTVKNVCEKCTYCSILRYFCSYNIINVQNILSQQKITEKLLCKSWRTINGIARSAKAIEGLCERTEHLNIFFRPSLSGDLFSMIYLLAEGECQILVF